MNYRSISDLSKAIRSNLFRVPADVDLVVGIPRSGMLAASILALNLNIRFCDVDFFLKNDALRSGVTRNARYPAINSPSDAKHILIVDDSVSSGESLQLIRNQIVAERRPQRVTYCAIYTAPSATEKVDVYFEVLKHPRVFEWNLMHRAFLQECCVDIDGVLCVDPTELQNDDGPAYKEFLRNASPLVIPSYPVGHLVTSRLERYRGETEQWLKKHNVAYGMLHMLDLPDAKTRRLLGCHASFKAEVYGRLTNTELFIESEPDQAKLIANLSGKHVLCFSTQEMCDPAHSFVQMQNKTRSLARRVLGKVVRESKKLISND